MQPHNIMKNGFQEIYEHGWGCGNDFGKLVELMKVRYSTTKRLS